MQQKFVVDRLFLTFGATTRRFVLGGSLNPSVEILNLGPVEEHYTLFACSLPSRNSWTN